MDMAGANLVEQGDQALVINTGYFGDRYAALLERYGAKVTQVRAAAGRHPSLEEVERALQSANFKLVTITHVDTSTGVLTDVRELASLARRYGALSLVDGVCSVAGEELRMSEWGVDVALTASQKAIGVPPGLALVIAGPRAMEAFQKRRSLVANFYVDWGHWLPVMQAYEARKPAYFGTPAVNLIFALNVSLGQILDEGVDARVARHALLSRACKAGVSALGLSQVPLDPQFAAHTMTAPRYPQGMNGPDFLAKVSRAGAVLAGGLLPSIRGEYFRIGHMGAMNLGDVLATLGAIESGLAGCGYSFERGAGVGAAMKVAL
jgi:alanine-glyoxylate transaminase/serine-glyoxylate transaminase/serine-pyruvate transaminase